MRINLRDVGDHITRRAHFTSASGNLRGGTIVLTTDHFRHLSPELAMTVNGSTYIVVSYDIPIGWYRPMDGWHINTEVYNDVTDRHQAALRNAIRPAVSK
jgi:hypothetical protein